MVERPCAASLVGRLLAIGKAGAEGEQGDLGALTDDAALADLEGNADLGHLDAAAFAARIAQRARTVVDRNLGCDHVHHFSLVRGCHDHHVRQTAEIGAVERARMRGAVGADEAGAVDGEAHRQALDRDVMHDLVVAALQEGRVDRAERLVSFGGEAGGKRHRVLLGDTDVEGPVGERLVEDVDAGAGRHRRGDGDDLVVLLGFLDQALAEHVLVGRRIRFGLGLRAGRDVELDDGVIFVGGSFRRAVALALLGHDVDQDRAGLHVADVLQDRQQMVEVMPVDRADIIEAEPSNSVPPSIMKPREYSSTRLARLAMILGRRLLICLAASRSVR